VPVDGRQGGHLGVEQIAMGIGEVGHGAHSDGRFESMPLQNRVTPLGELIADPARDSSTATEAACTTTAARSAGASPHGGGSPAASSSGAGTAPH
jgi:hypothetical protein